MFNKFREKINESIKHIDELEEDNVKLADRVIELERERDEIKEYANKLLKENEIYKEYKQERDDIQLAYEAKCEQLEKEKSISRRLKAENTALEKLYNKEIYEYNELLKEANSFSKNFISKMFHINEMPFQRKDK